MLYVLIGYLVVAFGAMAGFNRLGICSDGGDMFLFSSAERKARIRRRNAALAAALVVLAVVIGCIVLCVAFAGSAAVIAGLVILAGIPLAWLCMGLLRTLRPVARRGMIAALQG